LSLLLLAFEGALLANDRTAEQVKKRARFLGLLSGGGIASRLRRTRRGAQQDADAALIVADGAIAAEIAREQQLQQMAGIRQAAKGLIAAASRGKKQGERALCRAELRRVVAAELEARAPTPRSLSARVRRRASSHSHSLSRRHRATDD
jgi:hypothetical protein